MKKVVHLALFLLFSILMINNPLVSQYISLLKAKSIAVNQTTNPLFQEINNRAGEYEKKPINAKIDPVWKAIPGYNGIKVDVPASYKKMKKDGKFNEEKLVYKQISPEVHLTDLPPAAVYRGNPEKPMVSFIINVAWGNEYLSGMLATLKKHNVSASFFLEGRWVKNNPELAKMIAEAGHEIGNHSYTHPNMKTLPPAEIIKEIKRTNEVIEATTGKRPKWLAPPSGSYREEVVKIASEFNMGTVMWSLDTIDWQKPAPEVLINRIIPKLHNGALILMHPTESTAKALDQLIMQIKQKNLKIDTVSSLLSEERIVQNK
ncbi:sporulation protein, polysaccharide deacetylase family [Bacillus methanolicus PB1]|uniref:Sporulation protein, polysaccharide deacetylase family n=1 Tax=Bacillus methanolicus PB1 TaxID=997296 RepID=I3E4N1_BACMT|nr:polysaccharide deacetylase family protein [Bacillus methanolicus]EIJ81452.1 sporulation protein, polysaccharide deacetylase family [Bacillus methanolicus PB1]